MSNNSHIPDPERPSTSNSLKRDAIQSPLSSEQQASTSDDDDELNSVNAKLLKLKEKLTPKKKHKVKHTASADELMLAKLRLIIREELARAHGSSETRPKRSAPTLYCTYCRRTNHSIDQCRRRPGPGRPLDQGRN